jgi:hypothetical protein
MGDATHCAPESDVFVTERTVRLHVKIRRIRSFFRRQLTPLQRLTVDGVVRRNDPNLPPPCLPSAAA